MKDVTLALKGQKVEEKKLGEQRKKINQKYWFGWAGRYGAPKKG